MIKNWTQNITLGFLTLFFSLVAGTSANAEIMSHSFQFSIKPGIYYKIDKESTFTITVSKELKGPPSDPRSKDWISIRVDGVENRVAKFENLWLNTKNGYVEFGVRPGHTLTTQKVNQILASDLHTLNFELGGSFDFRELTGQIGVNKTTRKLNFIKFSLKIPTFKSGNIDEPFIGFPKKFFSEIKIYRIEEAGN